MYNKYFCSRTIQKIPIYELAKIKGENLAKLPISEIKGGKFKGSYNKHSILEIRPPDANI